MNQHHERFVRLLMRCMAVGETITSVGAIDRVMTHLESGLGGRYHSTQFIPSRHQVGYIMSKTKQFEKIATRSSAVWRRIE